MQRVGDNSWEYLTSAPMVIALIEWWFRADVLMPKGEKIDSVIRK
jgi:hypothetical protein